MRHLKRDTWPYQIMIRNEVVTDICDWCRQCAGTQMKEWVWFTRYDDAVFAFNDESTYIMFKLRWK